MAEIILFPGLIHFDYRARKAAVRYAANEKTFRDFLKAKSLLVSREGWLYKKRKDGIDLTKTWGRVVSWGTVESFSTVTFTSRKRTDS